MHNKVELQGYITNISKINTTVRNNKIINLVVANETVTHGNRVIQTFNAVAFNGLALFIVAMSKQKTHIKLVGELKKRKQGVEIVIHAIEFI